MKYCTSCKAKYDDSVSFCSIDGEVLEADPASIVDTVLDGQYQMEALLGKGGMGAVYRARHILLGDRVAIKVLPPEVRNNAEWLRRFRREGQAARRFRHPNAVTVYDLRTAADGTIYMVMEYVEGHTLDHEIKTRGQFSAREAFEVLTPIMSVLDTAHSMGVVHRDLKPENIMVGNATENGEPVVKLLDLGIAKMREIAGDNGGNTALTMAGQVLGTPYYMSPEQWGEIPRDGSSEIDGRADIYSLGLVFYEMILGRRCFSGNTLPELRREHITTAPRPLHELVADVPLGFSDAIMRATAKDRGDRPATARVLADELRAGLDTPSRATAPTGEQSTVLPETVAIPRGVQTNSDVNAPTILTIEPAPTSPVGRPVTADNATVYEPAKPAVPAGTVVESAPSIVTVPQVPRPAPEVPKVVHVAPAPKSKAGLFIGLAVVVLLVIVGGGVGAFVIWNKTRTTTNPASGANTNTTTAPAGPTEISRYWLELEPAAAGGTPTKVAALVPVASGQSFKFHFVFNEDGYLYIFGPGGDTNAPTAFLTTKPLALTGVKSNKVTKGVEYSFPNGEQNNLTLDKTPGTDNFTIVFSRTRLESPAFFNEEVTGEPLPATQQSALKTFINSYGDKKPLTELDESNAQSPFIKVKATAEQTNNPIVFEIRIQHN